MAPRSTDRLSISEASQLLGRTPHTLRSWDRNNAMPARLRPKRDSAGHRYWTFELIAQIKVWMEINNFHPGSAFYQALPDEVEAHIAHMRAARPKKKTPAS